MVQGSGFRVCVKRADSGIEKPDLEGLGSLRAVSFLAQVVMGLAQAQQVQGYLTHEKHPPPTKRVQGHYM